MTKDFIQDPVFPECPIRNILVRIGGKWTLAVLYTLGGSDSPMQWCETVLHDCKRVLQWCEAKLHRNRKFSPPRGQ